MRLTRAFVIAAALLASSSTAHAAASPIDVAAWRADLQRLATELPARHANAFHRMSHAAWDSAVARIDRKLPTMTRNQVVVAFMQLVALPRDGHTAINPAFDPALQFRYYPLELYSFEDGLYVRSAMPAQAALVGAKVLKIGKLSADDAMSAVGSVVPAENEWWRRAWAVDRLMIPEILDGLGIADDVEKLPIEIERSGKRETVTIAPAGKIEPRGHDPRGPVDRSKWTTTAASATPLWRRNPDQPYWFEYVAPQKTLYVSYRMVMDLQGHGGSQGGTNVAFWRSVFAAADSLKPEKLVIDLRENMGGNNFFNRQVVRGLIRRNELDNRNRLYVVIGRRTFSAAMNLAQDLEKWTNATFVGEPTGNATFFYGDHTTLELANSHIQVNVSTLAWRPYDPRDKRDFIAPAIYAPLTSRDEREGNDPVWDAIQSAPTGPSFTETMEKAAVAGDTAAVERILRGEKDKVVNRFKSGESEANTLGYSLLNSGRGPAAIAVFRAITKVYPQSANAWDSYGEALLLTNQHKDAVAAYKRALELNPNQDSARQALARLSGGAPPGH